MPQSLHARVCRICFDLMSLRASSPIVLSARARERPLGFRFQSEPLWQKIKNHMKKLRFGALIVAVAGTLACGAYGEDFRIGLIGLDTSHVIAFSKVLNATNSTYGCKVVAGFPMVSKDLPSSCDRIEKYTAQLRDEFGVKIVGSIEELLGLVDGVMVEAVDGRPHLAQARPVIAAGKPLFIDKPVAASLADAMEIFRLAEEKGVPCWSSSSLRYAPWALEARGGSLGQVLGCDAFSPCALEEHHPDLYWYGIHGVELLFTVMGPGCKSVRRVHTPDFDQVTGVWDDGRIGTFRGTRKGKHDYGATIFGSKKVVANVGYGGYEPLLAKVAEFFKTKKVPVEPKETIEICAFMTAADESKKRGGAEVTLEEVMTAARAKK